MKSTERRLDALELATNADPRGGLRVLLVERDGTVKDTHSGETWANLDAAPAAQATLIIRQRKDTENERDT